MERIESLIAAALARVEAAPTQALGLAAAVLALLLLLAAFRRRRRSREIEEGLAYLIESQQAAESDFQERLTAHERNIAATLDRKLGLSSSEIGAALDKGRAQTHTTLTDLAERIGKIDAAQTKLSGLAGQIEGIERTLANKQARGAYGEARLSDLLQDALPRDAYAEQAQLSNGRRADALVRLPSPPGSIAIDSKFPLERFLDIANAEDRATEATARKAFARDVVKHIGDIADRYIVPGETADCALMFVPSEAVYAEIQARCRDAVEVGFQRRVYVVSPTTLWATLNTARAVMRDARLHEHAEALGRESRALATEAAALAGKAESARRRLELAEAELAELARAARRIEKRGQKIADIDDDSDASEHKSLNRF